MDDSNGVTMQMPVAPAYAGGYPVYQNGGGFGGFGGDSGWLVLLLILAFAGGGWGGGFGGFGGGFGGYGNMMLGYDFPWLLNGQQQISNNTNNGFRDALINDGITSIRDGISGLSTQLCGCCGDMQMSLANGFAGVQQSLCSGFAGTTAAVNGAQNAISQQLYGNEIASLNRSFAEQTANTAGFTGVQSGLCDIRYGNATNTRDIIDSQTRGTQAILDKLCSLELDAKNDTIAQLRSQINELSRQASQVAQTAEIRANNATVANQLVAELRSCPIPSQPVYGNQPIFTCGGNSTGCGCNGGFVN